MITIECVLSIQTFVSVSNSYQQIFEVLQSTGGNKSMQSCLIDLSKSIFRRHLLMAMSGSISGGKDFSQLPDFILRIIASFCDAGSLAHASASCSIFHAIFSDEDNWKRLCEYYGFQQQSVTKTRGRKPWKEVYLSTRCVECNQVGTRGVVRMDINGGNLTRYHGVDSPSSSLIPLCAPCFTVVHTMYSAERSKSALPTVKKKSRFVWQQLCNLIPVKMKKSSKIKRSRQTRADEEFYGADANNSLIRKIVRK